MATEPAAPYTSVREDEPVDASALLEALDDETCREILNVLRDRRLTAQEISASSDIPQSTTYRKLDLLAAAGLVDSSVRIAPAENNPTEYTTAADGATIRLDQDGGFEIDLVEEERGQPIAPSD
ncbi:MAG: winged helix-turn-helix domain-containing protein [Haloarculaceae archaeon]